MRFKIYRKKSIGQINFSKEFYSLPCDTDIIIKLYRKLEIENACIIITDIAKERLEQFRRDERREIKVLQNLHYGFDVYIKDKKECDIPNIIKKALESAPEYIFILENVETMQLHEIVEKFETYPLEQLIQDRIILSVLVIWAYENEMFYLYDTERKSIEEQGKFFVFS
ncbi:MAG: hypothetical protein ACI4DN_09480 [Lachnospiraceae bacterium]